MIKKAIIYSIIIILATSYSLTLADRTPLPTPIVTIRYVGGLGPGNYTTILDAINDSSAGDTVFVYAGVYYEKFDYFTSLNLIGENRDTTIIDGSGTGIIVNIWNSTISGFTIQNGTRGIQSWSTRVTNTRIRWNDIGIALAENSNDNLIKDNLIESNNWGVASIQEKNMGNGNRFLNNTIFHNNFWNNSGLNAHDFIGSGVSWDKGYPTGGNYWDDYTGEDTYNGPYQNLSGSDGIGDTPYQISNSSGEVYDDYPLMNPCEQNPPIFGTPTPTNGSINKPLSLTWSISINDPEGNRFSWTIQCSNGQTNNGHAVTNGTKTLALSGLAYSTTYKVWVNATDGSGTYTREWFTFTTKESGGSTPPQENEKPIADLSAGEPYQSYVNTAITFDGSASTDTDGNITLWQWTFGDGNTATGEIVQHTYTLQGNYTVTLTVKDDDEAQDTDTTTAIITLPNSSPTKPIITGPTAGKQKTSYVFTVSSTDADDNMLQYMIDWGDTNTTTSNMIPNGTQYIINHTWINAGIYMVKVKVTDNQSESDETRMIVLIDIKYVSGLGYLIDNNSDSIYDTFYSNTTGKETSVEFKDGAYLIDVDNDGKWEYTYDSVEGLTDYTEKTPGFELVLLVCSFIFIIIWRRRRM